MQIKKKAQLVKLLLPSMEVQGTISPKQFRIPCCYCHKDRVRPLKRDWKEVLSSTDSRALYKCLENIPECQFDSQIQSTSGLLLPFLSAAPKPLCMLRPCCCLCCWQAWRAQAGSAPRQHSSSGSCTRAQGQEDAQAVSASCPPVKSTTLSICNVPQMRT